MANVVQYAQASGNAANARFFLQKLVDEAATEEHFFPGQESSPNNAVDACITDGIKQFYGHYKHGTGGTSTTETQDAIDATLTAACFALHDSKHSVSVGNGRQESQAWHCYQRKREESVQAPQATAPPCCCDYRNSSSQF